MRTVTYGIGGYDPSKPNNNVIDEVEHEDDPLPVEVVEGLDDTLAVVEANDAWAANPGKDHTAQVKALTEQVNSLLLGQVRRDVEAKGGDVRQVEEAMSVRARVEVETQKPVEPVNPEEF